MSSQLRNKSTYGPESKLLELETNDRKSSRVHELYDDVICFRLTKKSHSRLQWDCIPILVEFNQSKKNSPKKNPKMSKTTKKATKENKNDVAHGHKNEAQSP